MHSNLGYNAVGLYVNVYETVCKMQNNYVVYL